MTSRRPPITINVLDGMNLSLRFHTFFKCSNIAYHSLKNSQHPLVKCEYSKNYLVSLFFTNAGNKFHRISEFSWVVMLYCRNVVYIHINGKTCHHHLGGLLSEVSVHTYMHPFAFQLRDKEELRSVRSCGLPRKLLIGRWKATLKRRNVVGGWEL